MPIKTTCPHCNRAYHLADTLLGKALKCKGCGGTFVAAAPPVARPVPRPQAAVPDAEDDRPARQASPKAKSSGRLIWWLIGGGCAAAVLLGLVLVGGGVLVAVLMWPTTKATPENFAKLKQGMSEKEVIALLGQPNDTSSLPPDLLEFVRAGEPNVKTLGWRGEGDAKFNVVFQDGKVLGALGSDGRNVYAPLVNDAPAAGAPVITHTKPNAGAKPPTSKAMAEGFRKVRPGMSEAQVVDLLGPPTDSNSVAAQQVGDLRIPPSKFVTVQPA